MFFVSVVLLLTFGLISRKVPYEFLALHEVVFCSRGIFHSYSSLIHHRMDFYFGENFVWIGKLKWRNEYRRRLLMIICPSSLRSFVIGSESYRLQAIHQ